MGRKGHELSMEVKELMISLNTEGHLVNEIARILTRPQSTVYDVINNYLKHGPVENTQRSGRPKLVMIDDCHKLERLVKLNLSSCLCLHMYLQMQGTFVYKNEPLGPVPEFDTIIKYVINIVIMC